MADHIDDLGVQHVTNEKKLVLLQRDLAAADHEAVQRTDVAQLDLGALEGGDGAPRHQMREPPVGADGQPVHHGMLGPEPGGQVSQLPDDVPSAARTLRPVSRLRTSTGGA